MEQILQANGLHKETVTTMITHHKNTKALVTKWRYRFFDIITKVLKGDTFAVYIFIICLEGVFQKSIDVMEFTQKKTRFRRCPAETITDAN